MGPMHMPMHGMPMPGMDMGGHASGMSGWDYGALVLLGAFHGINPAMGWLFAVWRGLQARARVAVVAALGPIAVGHAASMALTVLVVEEFRVVASDTMIRTVGAALLVAVALRQIVRNHRHPRWVGMNLRRRELALWSFLMSTAHGAGLMLIPVVLGIGVRSHDDMLMPSSLPPLAGRGGHPYGGDGRGRGGDRPAGLRDLWRRHPPSPLAQSRPRLAVRARRRRGGNAARRLTITWSRSGPGRSRCTRARPSAPPSAHTRRDRLASRSRDRRRSG
jgi:hypothetical protein